ncbi:hypothetical protein [Herbiconiux sp.]|uniref:hypothetical protein n=1 Tax=Herbiconiux sp. TaxID=1871186 RepID=UPI0025C432D3|nr:hypothetical protein [Herbiconiux sp.]
MTLTSILPTLRATIPDPLVIDRWPEWTHPTTTDVVVSGVSLLRLEEARLIGRISRRRSRAFRLASATLSLPEDLSVGDLIAVPCRGAVCCRTVRTRS